MFLIKKILKKISFHVRWNLNHIDLIKNKFDFTKARRREREKGNREIDNHERDKGEGVKKNPSLATASGDPIPSCRQQHCFSRTTTKPLLPPYFSQQLAYLQETK